MKKSLAVLIVVGSLVLWHPLVAEAASDIVKVSTAVDIANASSYTFTSQNIGVPAADRCVQVVMHTGISSNAAVSITGVTIGGNAATEVYQKYAGAGGGVNVTRLVAVFGLLVPSGTSDTIGVTPSTTVNRMRIEVYNLFGTADCTTLADSDFSEAADPTVALDVPAGGSALGACTDGGATPTTWTGLTKDYDNSDEAAVMLSTTASDDFAIVQTGLTLKCDVVSPADSAEIGIFLAWGPATTSAFPTVVSAVTDTDNASDTNHTFDLPSSMTVGNLVMVFWGGGATDSTPNFACSGWTVLEDQIVNFGAGHLGVAYKTVDGSEDATVTCTTDTAEVGASIALEITGQHDTTPPEDGAGSNGTSAAPNSEALDPTAWATENTLWISATYVDGNFTLSGYPSTFADNHTQSTLATQGSTALATREDAGSSVDPDAFTASGSNNWAAVTIAIRPSGAAVVVSPKTFLLLGVGN